MAATLIGETWRGRKGKLGREWAREYTRVFLVSTSSASDNAATVLAAAGLPAKGDAYPGDTGSVCVELEPSNDGESPLHWTVTANYANAVYDIVENPEDRPTKWGYSTEWVDKTIVYDLDDNVIQSSSYELFDPPPTMRVPVRVITASFISTDWNDEDDYDPYVDRVNSIGVTLGTTYCPPGTAFLEDIRAEQGEENGIIHYTRSYTFKKRTDIYKDTGTTVGAGGVTAGTAQTCVLASLANIVEGSILFFGSGGTLEQVVVLSVDVGTTSITADFAHNHSMGENVLVRRYFPWQYAPYDQGFMEWDDVNGVFNDILTEQGQPIPKPALLDGDGNRLDTSNPASVPVLLEFRTRETADFNGITFP